MRKIKWIILGILIILLFTSCADAVPYEVFTNDKPYGFLYGLWHGMIIPVSFIGSIFDSEIAIYAINNNGGWYDFGFWLGIGGLGTGLGKAFD